MNQTLFKPSKDRTGYDITLLVDTPGSWILPWAEQLRDILSRFHHVSLCLSKEEIPEGDMAFLLGCTKRLPPRFLEKNKMNLVVHESELPRGRGWSPVSWQVLEGADRIPVVLFEVGETLDSGPIYLHGAIELDGTELLPEIKEKQGKKTVELVLGFLEKWPDLSSAEQVGKPTFFPRRTVEQDRLDINRTIAENFDHLRIVDNERYPAWFEYRGRKYEIRIYPRQSSLKKV